MKKCPKCGCKQFIVSAHVTQGWIVDEYGEFVRVTEDCMEVTHFPDNEDLWTCTECGYENPGSDFEVESEEKEND